MGSGDRRPIRDILFGSLEACVPGGIRFEPSPAFLGTEEVRLAFPRELDGLSRCNGPPAGRVSIRALLLLLFGRHEITSFRHPAFAPEAGRTRRMGVRAWRSTRSATLPRTHLDTPDRP